MSKLFDFNIHAVPSSLTLEKIHKEEKSLTPNSVLTNLDNYKKFLLQADAINLNILTDNFFEPDQNRQVISSLHNVLPNLISITTTTPIIFLEAIPYLNVLQEIGVKGIHFHSYVQKISEADYPDVVSIAKRASEMGFHISIDTSYGTTKLYDFNNLKLAARICEVVTQTPVILVHAGGLRLADALALADYCSNIYLETSFSMNYLAGSPYEDLYAYVFRKLGSERVIFGSDLPYFRIDEAISVLDRVLTKASFSGSEKENVFYYNAARIVGLI